MHEQNGALHISELGTGQVIAEHTVCLDKGQILKNRHHYRELSLRIETLEKDLHELLPLSAVVTQLCALLKATSPKIYKDQLAGAKQVLSKQIKHYGPIPEAELAQLIDTPRLTARGLKERLTAWSQRGGWIKAIRHRSCRCLWQISQPSRQPKPSGQSRRWLVTAP